LAEKRRLAREKASDDAAVVTAQENERKEQEEKTSIDEAYVEEDSMTFIESVKQSECMLVEQGSASQELELIEQKLDENTSSKLTSPQDLEHIFAKSDLPQDEDQSTIGARASERAFRDKMEKVESERMEKSRQSDEERQERKKVSDHRFTSLCSMNKLNNTSFQPLSKISL